jgi:DNA-binding response OmpR family regulator
MIPSSTTPLVLVADDEPTMLELVARHLKSMADPKVDVIEASDGDQAWRLAREHLPDLVVLDVMMPGMSGWEVCRKIREDVALAHTGVVMLTGIGENLNQMTSPLYGADAYVDKPFEFGELDEKVKGALEARASQREGVSRPVMNGATGPAEDAARKKKSSRPPVAKHALKDGASAAPKSSPKKVAKTKPKRAKPAAAKIAKAKPKRAKAAVAKPKRRKAKPAAKKARANKKVATKARAKKVARKGAVAKRGPARKPGKKNKKR